jgi:hypothetical protein
MGSSNPGDGYCGCADCRPKPWKMGKATTGRGGVKPDPVDSDGFWDRVHEHSELRDLERKTRR